jgi:phosphatidylglycerophosphate synthase
MDVGARRPVPARNAALSRSVADWLSRRRVDPNAISVASFVFSAFAGAIAALETGPDTVWPWLVVAVLVELRLVANMLDGMVAVARGVASKTGELYNEVTDRLSDVATLVGVGYAWGGDEALGYLAALAAVLTAYVRAVGTSVGAPADFRGPMAKPHRMHAVAFLASVSAVAAFLDLPYGDVADGYGLPPLILGLIAAGASLTALRRLIGIARYLP